MTVTEMIVGELTCRRDYLNQRLTLHRDAFSSLGIASLEKQISDLDDEIARTIGAQR